MSFLTDIRTAIYSIGATITSSSGGFYYNEAKQDTNYPMIIYYLPDDVRTGFDVQRDQDEILIQFSLFDRRITTNGSKISSVALETVAEQLISKFNIILPVSNYATLRFKRDYTRPASITDDGNFWQIIIQYRIQLIK